MDVGIHGLCGPLEGGGEGARRWTGLRAIRRSGAARPRLGGLFESPCWSLGEGGAPGAGDPLALPARADRLTAAIGRSRGVERGVVEAPGYLQGRMHDLQPQIAEMVGAVSRAAGRRRV